MLKISAGGKGGGFCDGIARRDFIRIGAMGVGGMTMANLFEAEARAGVGSSHKAVINIFLGGGPPHQDMWEIKPQRAKGVYRHQRSNRSNSPYCFFANLSAFFKSIISINNNSI